MPAEEIQALASESDSDEGSDEETKDKVTFSLSLMWPFAMLLLVLSSKAIIYYKISSFF